MEKGLEGRGRVGGRLVSPGFLRPEEEEEAEGRPPGGLHLPPEGRGAELPGEQR